MKPIFRELFRSFALGIIIFVILLLIALAGGKEVALDHGLMMNFLFVMLYTVSLHLANTVIFMVLEKFYNCMSIRRMLVGFVSSFFVSLFVVFLLRILEDVVVEGLTFKQYISVEKPSNYYVAMVITLVITLSLHVFYYYKKSQENRVKEQKIIAGTASAKFETLKNQIDPHFLFNSLNVLSSLIEENPDSAQRFTTSLSKVYRYVLEQKDKELVSVEEELAFAKTYMNLLKMRFENSVFYELPEKLINPDAKVVPLSLQLLLENTIKHNIVSQQKPLYIRIFEENGFLVVQNDLQKKEVLQDRKGVGLQNIVSRYAIITARKVQVEESAKHFTVRLPILTRQIGIMKNTEYSEQENTFYKAQKKVEDIKEFYANLFSYIVVNIGLAILNLLTSPEYLWFFWPLIGWGIGVAVHGMKVFNYMPFLGADWEERKIKELMEKERNNKWG